MAGFLVRQLGFSTDPAAYVGPPREASAHCSLVQSQRIAVRFWQRPSDGNLVPVNADLFGELRNANIQTPDEFFAPTALQLVWVHNEFPQEAWQLEIQDFWSGQPVSEDIKALPKPARDGSAHFTGKMTLLIDAGYQGEPSDMNRVHYVSLVPPEVIECYAGPILCSGAPGSAEEEMQVRGKIRYTRFENTRISCTRVAPPPAAPAAAAKRNVDEPTPILLCVFVLNYCLVNFA